MVSMKPNRKSAKFSNNWLQIPSEKFCYPNFRAWTKIHVWSAIESMAFKCFMLSCAWGTLKVKPKVVAFKNKRGL